MSAGSSRDPVSETLKAIWAVAGSPVASVPYGERPEIDAASDDDRRWFEAHPSAVTRYRPSYPGEFLLEVFPPSAREIVMVEVTQLAPGLRIKEPRVDSQFTNPAIAGTAVGECDSGLSTGDSA